MVWRAWERTIWRSSDIMLMFLVLVLFANLVCLAGIWIFWVGGMEEPGVSLLTQEIMWRIYTYIFEIKY